MRLFLYILRDYFKYVIGTLVLCLFLFVLFDFIHKTTRYFAKYQPKTEHIIQFYFYQMPSQIVEALPIAALLASVISMILLARSNEVTAMRASGMGPMQIGAPLAAGGVLLSFTALFLSETVVPKFAERMRFVQEVLMEGESDQEIIKGSRWLRQGERLFNFRDYDPIRQILADVKLIELRPDFRPRRSIRADQASFLPDLNAWQLTGIDVYKYRHDGTLESTQSRSSLTTVLPVEPTKLKKERRKPKELSFGELKDFVERGDNSGVDTLSYKVDFHMKMASPFAAFVVSLIGLRFGYRSERATDAAKGVLLALFIGFAYWVISVAGKALGNRGDLDPFIAAWMANLLVLSLILFDYLRARRV